ncbi:hypothetical protein AusDCA_1510 [Desulfitobacterium sp. AusDCA]
MKSDLGIKIFQEGDLDKQELSAEKSRCGVEKRGD